MQSKLVQKLLIVLLSVGLVSCGWTEKNVEKSDEFQDRLSSLLDNDGDGLSDLTEQELGTDPLNPDTDFDGITDGVEVNTLRSNPLSQDSDNGGLNDGIEFSYGFYLNDPSDDFQDSDGGGVADWIERGQGTNPNNPNDDISNLKDSDNDGLSDALEIAIGLDPNKPDTDEDGLSDATELLSGLSSPFHADTDGGGINDSDELAAGTDPQNAYDDRTPIEISILQAPNASSVNTLAEFLFELSDNSGVESVMCAHNLAVNGVYETCASGMIIELDQLAVGEHIFTIKVISVNGVVSTVHYRWVVEEAPARTCDSSYVKTKKVLVNFAKQTKTCEYGKNGNLEKKNVYIQAMARQTEDLGIQSGSEICDVDLAIDQDFWFDDHFVLSWNSNVIATNTDFVMTENNGLPTFDFDAIKGMKWATQKSYCVGGSMGTECNVPKHNKKQNFSMDLSEAARGQLVQALQTADSQQIELSILGDNDGSDCKHSGLQMEVEVKYLEPEALQ